MAAADTAGVVAPPVPPSPLELVRKGRRWRVPSLQRDFVLNAAAGSLAGLMEHSAMYPVDTVKTHLQALATRGGRAAPSRHLVKLLYKESGAAGFFRGLPTFFAGCIPAHIALFSVYEGVKKYITPTPPLPLVSSDPLSISDPSLTLSSLPAAPLRITLGSAPLAAALCGVLATASHDLVITPIDVLKQRLQLGCYRNGWHCLRSILKTEGPVALYRSIPTTLAMNLPYGAVLVPVNERLKTLFGVETALEGKRDEAKSPPYALSLYFLSAGAAGAVAGALTTPLDVIKTRLQTQDVVLTSVVSVIVTRCGLYTSCVQKALTRVATAAAAAAPRYTGFWSALRVIVAEEGFMGLWRGVGARVALAAPSAAICWGTYETAKFGLKSYFGDFD